MELLDTISLSSATGEFSFTNIPSGYKDLRITGVLRGNSTSDSIPTLQINLSNPNYGAIEQYTPNQSSYQSNNSQLGIVMPVSPNNSPIGLYVDIGHANTAGLNRYNFIASGAALYQNPSYGRGSLYKGTKSYTSSSRVTSLKFATHNGYGYGAGTYLTLWGLAE